MVRFLCELEFPELQDLTWRNFVSSVISRLGFVSAGKGVAQSQAKGKVNLSFRDWCLCTGRTPPLQAVHPGNQSFCCRPVGCPLGRGLLAELGPRTASGPSSHCRDNMQINDPRLKFWLLLFSLFFVKNLGGCFGFLALATVTSSLLALPLFLPESAWAQSLWNSLFLPAWAEMVVGKPNVIAEVPPQSCCNWWQAF